MLFNTEFIQKIINAFPLESQPCRAFLILAGENNCFGRMELGPDSANEGKPFLCRVRGGGKTEIKNNNGQMLVFVEHIMGAGKAVRLQQGIAMHFQKVAKDRAQRAVVFDQQDHFGRYIRSERSCIGMVLRRCDVAGGIHGNCPVGKGLQKCRW